jgi:hypothetical protein
LMTIGESAAVAGPTEMRAAMDTAARTSLRIFPPTQVF